MGYPVDNEFIWHYTVLACRRYRRWLLGCVLVAGIAAGAAFFLDRAVLYQINGVVVFCDSGEVAENVARTALQKTLEKSLASVLHAPAAAHPNKVWSVSAHRLENALVLDWQVVFDRRSQGVAFLGHLPGNMYAVQKKFSTTKTVFFADPEPLRFYPPDKFGFKGLLTLFAGGAAGLLFGIAVAFIAVFYDRSIGDLAEFARSYSLPVLGVLPVVDRKKRSWEKLTDNNDFLKAVNSLRLNIQFCKPPIPRAFVIAVCGITGDCGTTSVAESLHGAMGDAGAAVLLVNDRNSNMTPARQLAGRMEDFLAEQADKYDFIILDLPDVQSSSAPLIISKLADTVLLVCDYRNCAGYTLKVILWRLRKAGINIAGFVINRFLRHKRPGEYELYQHFFYHYRA